MMMRLRAANRRARRAGRWHPRRARCRALRISRTIADAVGVDLGAVEYQREVIREGRAAHWYFVSRDGWRESWVIGLDLVECTTGPAHVTFDTTCVATTCFAGAAEGIRRVRRAVAAALLREAP